MRLSQLIWLSSKFAGMVGVNGLILAQGYRQQQKNYKWFTNQSPTKQKEIYNNCPVQKFGHDFSFWSAVAEREVTLDPKSHEKIAPLKPFKP